MQSGKKGEGGVFMPDLTPKISALIARLSGQPPPPEPVSPDCQPGKQDTQGGNPPPGGEIEPGGPWQKPADSPGEASRLAEEPVSLQALRQKYMPRKGEKSIPEYMRVETTLTELAVSASYPDSHAASYYSDSNAAFRQDSHAAFWRHRQATPVERPVSSPPIALARLPRRLRRRSISRLELAFRQALGAWNALLYRRAEGELVFDDALQAAHDMALRRLDEWLAVEPVITAGQEAELYHQKTGRCPWCQEPGPLHEYDPERHGCLV